MTISAFVSLIVGAAAFELMFNGRRWIGPLLGGALVGAWVGVLLWML